MFYKLLRTKIVYVTSAIRRFAYFSVMLYLKNLKCVSLNVVPKNLKLSEAERYEHDKNYQTFLFVSG